MSTQTRFGRKTTRPKLFEDIDEEEDQNDRDFVVVDKENQAKGKTTYKKRKQSEKVIKAELTDSNVEVFCCQKCPATFPSQSSYYYHVNQHGQANPKKHRCKYCDFSTAYEKNLMGHMELHEQFEKNGRSEKLKRPIRPIAKAVRRNAKSKSSDSESSSPSVSRSVSPAPPPPPPPPSKPVEKMERPARIKKTVLKEPEPVVKPAKVVKPPKPEKPVKAPKEPKEPKKSSKAKSKSISVSKTPEVPYVPSQEFLEEAKDHWLLTTNFDIPKEPKVKRKAMNYSNRMEFYKNRDNKKTYGHMTIFDLHHSMKKFAVPQPPGPLMTSSRIKAMNGVFRFKCPKPNCLFKASWERELADHLDCHGWEAEFKCDKCDYMNDKEENVQHHRENHHSVQLLA